MAINKKPNRKFPSLPYVAGDLPNHTELLTTIRNSLEIGQRRTADFPSSFVQVRDLIDLGVIDDQGNLLDGFGGSSDGVESIVEGTNISVDNTDPQNPIISSTGGGASALDDLTDVDAPSPLEGDYLRRNASGQWVTVGGVSNDADQSGDPFWEYVVALLKFDAADASTTMTDTTGKRVWTARGNAQIDTADFKFGTASLLLDGTGDYIDTPNSADFQVAALDFTYECWVKIAATGRIHTIFNKRDASSAEEHSFGIDSSNHLFASIYTGGAAIGSAVGTTALTTGVWYHVAFVRNGVSLMAFLDGNLEATAGVSTTAAQTNTEVMKIGRDGFNTARDFQGWIDSVRITKAVARYTASFTAPTAEWPTSNREVIIDDEIVVDSPTAYWKCDEPSGDLVDYSGNAFTLAPTGTSNYQRAPIVPSSVKSYLRVVGSAGTIYYSRAGTLGLATPITGSWTCEAVVRLEETASSGNHRILVMGASGESTATNYQIYCYITTSGGMGSFWEFGAGGTDNDIISTKSTIPKGVAHHFVWRKDATNRLMQFFIDGALIDSIAWAGANDVTGGSSCNTAIGDAFGSANSGYTVAHVAFYNKLLSDARIRAHAVAAGFRKV